MSSTDPREADDAIRRFFDAELLPLAERRRREGRASFPTHPDPAAATYYQTRSKTSMAPRDFEVSGTESVAAFEKALADLWRPQGYADLVAVAPGMARLAAMLQQREEQSEEISPFIYVMF